MPHNFAGSINVQVPGLLEQAALTLRPPGSPAEPVWLEDAAGTPVGFARRVERPWWLRWLGPTLAIHEALEEPMVFQVRRLWTVLPRWRVVDAENETVGTVTGGWLLDRWERPILRRRGPGVFETLDGQVAAGQSRAGEREQVNFHPPIQHEPFHKMLVLAAVLVERG
jgi:hypothetical protein